MKRDTRVIEGKRYDTKRVKKIVLEKSEEAVERAQTKPYDRQRSRDRALDQDTSLVLGRPVVAERASPVDENKMN